VDRAGKVPGFVGFWAARIENHDVHG
jgi:hypothetical protein